MRLDLAIVQHQISNLLLQVPELQEDEILRADMIEGETDAFDLLRQLEAKRREACLLIAGVEKTIAELKSRLGRIERREEALRRLAFKILEAANLRKVELPEATYSIRTGPRKVIITNEALIPDDLCRFKREPVKNYISGALSKGNTVPGAELSNAEEILTIRTK